MRPAVIYMRLEAPVKPAQGEPCNGCGVCCLSEPCPAGVLLSGRRSGACNAVRWDDAAMCYRCGAVQEPGSVLLAVLPGPLRFVAPALSWLLQRTARRWIAAGIGCDCSLEVAAASPVQTVSADQP